MSAFTSSEIVPRAVPGLKGISVSRIACGDTFTMLLTEQGILMSYGRYPMHSNNAQ